MENIDLQNLSLEELISLAAKRHLIDDWCFRDAGIHLWLGSVQVALTRWSAIAYVRGLLRGYEIARYVREERGQ